MSAVTRLKTTPKLHIVGEDASAERVFGSPQFIARDRNPALAPPPRRFVPTNKRPGDIVI